MLHYRRFSEEVLHPVPASEAYVKREGGKGWPEQCPPVRAANAYGFDVLASVDLELVKDDEGRWMLPVRGWTADAGVELFDLAARYADAYPLFRDLGADLTPLYRRRAALLDRASRMKDVP